MIYTISKKGYHTIKDTLDVIDMNLNEYVKIVDEKVAINIASNPSSTSADISWTGSGADQYRIRFKNELRSKG